ncbi:MAG TPA: cation diffusion facilitator family transporter [Acidimicrobiales bacterium]
MSRSGPGLRVEAAHRQHRPSRRQRWFGDHLHHGHDHGGHVHDHGRHFGGTGTADGSTAGLRVIGISVGILAVTALAQAALIGRSGSVALLADTVHNLSDCLSAVPLGLAFLLGRRPPNRRYTYGYGRAEDLAGACVVVMLALSAGFTAWQAVDRLLAPRDFDGHVGVVAVAGMVGFVGNEWVARYRIRTGRRIGSAALTADGLHARTDGLTSLAVVATAFGTLVGWRLADPLIGLAISLVIANLLRTTARDIYRRLMDGVDPDLVDRIDARLTATPGVRDVRRTRVRWVGHQLHVDANLVLDAELTLAHAHEVLERARHTLLQQIPRLGDAVLHVSPVRSADA